MKIEKNQRNPFLCLFSKIILNISSYIISIERNNNSEEKNQKKQTGGYYGQEQQKPQHKVYRRFLQKPLR
jgi:hypothetical protein